MTVSALLAFLYKSWIRSLSCLLAFFLLQQLHWHSLCNTDPTSPVCRISNLTGPYTLYCKSLFDGDLSSIRAVENVCVAPVRLVFIEPDIGHVMYKGLSLYPTDAGDWGFQWFHIWLVVSRTFFVFDRLMFIGFDRIVAVATHWLGGISFQSIFNMQGSKSFELFSSLFNK